MTPPLEQVLHELTAWTVDFRHHESVPARPFEPLSQGNSSVAELVRLLIVSRKFGYFFSRISVDYRNHAICGLGTGRSGGNVDPEDVVRLGRPFVGGQVEPELQSAMGAPPLGQLVVLGIEVDFRSMVRRSCVFSHVVLD